jgi:hypothetical protein
VLPTASKVIPSSLENYPIKGSHSPSSEVPEMSKKLEVLQKVQDEKTKALGMFSVAFSKQCQGKFRLGCLVLA